MNTLKKRARKALNLKQYNKLNEIEEVNQIDVQCPQDNQYILRMLVKLAFKEFQIPYFLEWTRPLVEASYAYQQQMGVEQPFAYITVRHGLVTSTTDDEWHVDGFSMNITHLPEQNYIWADHSPTEYVEKKIKFPKDFNYKEHNIHSFFPKHIEQEDIQTAKEKTLYALDPYIIHRRPKLPVWTYRTFVRVSYTPIEINDINNTQNPLLPREYDRDGVLAFRKDLIEYA